MPTTIDSLINTNRIQTQKTRSPKTSIELLAAQGGVVFPSKKQYIIFQHRSHVPEAPQVYAKGTGQPALITKDIYTCAGVVIRTNNSYALIHAMDSTNLHSLLTLLFYQYNKNNTYTTNQNFQIFIKTDHTRDKYEKALTTFFNQKKARFTIKQLGLPVISDIQWREYNMTVGLKNNNNPQ